MAGMKVSELDFLHLLPAFMRDDEAAIVLSKAMNRLVGEPSKRLKTIRVWDNIDHLNEEECDELAWELDVDWYDSTNMNLEKKQDTLKLAQQIKQKRGTKWAIECLISAYLGNGKVKEWFEYNDTPFCFKIETDAILTPEINSFIVMIQRAKNVRSHLRAIEISRKTSQRTFTGGASYSWSKPAAILDGYEYNRKTVQNMYTGVGIGTQTQKSTAILEN